jgi:hypothetical protein
MLLESSNYKPSMARFLNNFSKKAKAFDEPRIEYLRTLFEAFLLACAGLPDDAFVSARTRRFSIALFEAVFSAAMTPAYRSDSTGVAPIAHAQLRELDTDTAFIESSEKASADKANVDKRLARAAALMA